VATRKDTRFHGVAHLSAAVGERAPAD
jgi:hypothetical protein